MEVPNLKYIKELAEGDIAFEESILNVIKIEFPEEKVQFIKNFEQKKFKDAASNVHKIKHKISILGLKKGLVLASNFEKDLKEGDLKLYKDFVKVLNKIHVYLEC